MFEIVMGIDDFLIQLVKYCNREFCPYNSGYSHRCYRFFHANSSDSGSLCENCKRDLKKKVRKWPMADGNAHEFQIKQYAH